MKDRITVIGAAIVDIIAGPVNKEVFGTGSMPMDTIQMSFGGDALNESVIMSRLGLDVEIVTKLGSDEAGDKVVSFLKDNGVSCRVTYEDGLETGINIVLVDNNGQRSFLTNPNGSLRKLGSDDIAVNIPSMGNIVCFASMFVSPLLDIPSMERIFKDIKSDPQRILVVDMTTAKNGETLEDIRCLLPYIDFLIPNEIEAARLTGNNNPEENAKLFIDAGVRNIIIKCGERGCIAANESESVHIDPYKNATVKDTTGAGDSFVAGFVWGLTEGMSLVECCRFGCAVSSCVIEKFGAQKGIEHIDKALMRYGQMIK